MTQAGPDRTVGQDRSTLSPREAARIMLRRLGGVFDGGRWRAENIARTEMLDAHRASALAARKANTDLLSGWEWSATLDRRTCPACLAMDGQRFDTETPGPEGHQQCRCTALPITKSWRDLGFNVDEPVSTRKSGREWFDEQPEEVQLDVMGPGRLAAVASGDEQQRDEPQHAAAVHTRA